MVHLNHRRIRKVDSQVRPEPTTIVYNRPESSNNIQNHQKAYETCHSHAKVAATILERQYSPTTGHHHHAASKNIAELEKLIHRSGQNIPLPSRTDQKHLKPNSTIKSLIEPATKLQE